MFDLKHGNVLSIFQKKLCYRCNHLGVIPFEYIAGVTRDGKFAGSMINQSTQIVLKDEWTNDSLYCEDAKRILQGYYLFILLLFSVITPHCSMFYFQLTGFFVKMVIILDSMCISLSGGILLVPQKHREASKCIYNSGFYITTNVYSDFGEGLDGQEIKKRLKVFETKSLKHKDTSVTGKVLFLMINQYMSEVDLVHLQHVRQNLCDND